MEQQHALSVQMWHKWTAEKLRPPSVCISMFLILDCQPIAADISLGLTLTMIPVVSELSHFPA